MDIKPLTKGTDLPLKLGLLSRPNQWIVHFCLDPIPWFCILKIYTLTLELVVIIMLRQQLINQCCMFEHKIVIHVNFMFYNKYKLKYFVCM
jgi:hypothetical protein